MIHAAILLAAMAVSAAPGPADLAGKVVDRAGKPVGAATVLVHEARPRVGVGTISPLSQPDCGKKAATDAAGKFLIAGLDRELLFGVVVVAEGFRSKSIAQSDPLHGPLDVTLDAAPADTSGQTVFRGRVIDGAGKPVVGAIVTPFDFQLAEGAGGTRREGVDTFTVTDSRGEFRTTHSNIFSGHRLSIEARGFARCYTDATAKDGQVQEIRMTEGVTVRGRLLAEGKPAAGVVVGLVLNSGNVRKVVTMDRIATTDDGWFAFANVRAGDDYLVYTMMSNAVRLGGVLLPERISIGADGTTKDLGDRTLAPARRLSGRVILTDGKAIPEKLWLGLSRSRELGDAPQSVRLAADGSFSFAGVPEGPVRLDVRIAGYRLSAARNRFQQVAPSQIAIFVEGDKSGIELYFEPEPANDAGTER